MTGEKAIHNEFAAYLRKVGLPFFHSRMDRPTSQTCGDPDFAVFREGRIAFVEFKYRKGRLSPAQADRIAELARAGCAVKLARSVEEAIRYIEATLGLDASHEAPATPDEAFRKDGDEPCHDQLATQTSTTQRGSNGTATSEPEVAPKFYLAHSRAMGDVVICRNQKGEWNAIRTATAADRSLPRLTDWMA